VLLGILDETQLFGPALLMAVGGVFALSAGVAVVRHRKSLRDRGIMILKRKHPRDA
jgi:hypothetical protein